MTLGILDTVALAVALAFAVPLAIFGATMLRAGDPLGAVFVALAVALVGAKVLLPSVDDVAARAVGTVAKEPDEEN